MKLASFSRIPLTFQSLVLAFIMALLLCAPGVQAQNGPGPTQLSLADILIALRSKKATITEKNTILSDAVKKRGITFALTPEIAKELQNTGADYGLIESIRQKSPAENIASMAVPKTEPEPKPASTPPPPPPDFNFYQKRAGDHVAKGEFDMAVADYDKALELKPGDASTYLYRGLVFDNTKNFDRAIGDLDKAIELNPAGAAAYVHRGNIYEKKGDVVKAMADYQKAADLDTNNEQAKNSLQRLRAAEQARIEAEAKAKAKAAEPVAAPVPVPERPKIVNAGLLSPDRATKLVKPVYSAIAQKMNVQGEVKVEVSLDAEGNVTSAKAVSGQAALRTSAEEAAKRSTFKPILAEGQPAKATGYIVYNFTIRQD